jgi:hypothetical protein
MTHTFRLDGDSEKVVSDAYDLLQQENGDVQIDTTSALNIGNHPQSATALDVITSSSIDDIREVLDTYGFDVTVAEPVEEDATL